MSSSGPSAVIDDERFPGRGPPVGLRAGIAAWRGSFARLDPVVRDTAQVVDAVAGSLGQPLDLRGELDVDVYRLHRAGAETDLIARVFGPDVDRASVDAAARVLQSQADKRFAAQCCTRTTPVLSIGAGRPILIIEYVEPSPLPVLDL